MKMKVIEMFFFNREFFSLQSKKTWLIIKLTLEKLENAKEK